MAKISQALQCKAAPRLIETSAMKEGDEPNGFSLEVLPRKHCKGVAMHHYWHQLTQHRVGFIATC